MSNSGSKHSWCALVLGGLLAVSLVTGAAAQTAAAEDEEEAFDTKIFRGILKGFGLRSADEAGIEYRERSPLVVPPSRNLPAPETASVADKTPAWPKDPDVKRAKELKAARSKQRKSVDEESRPELPSELNRQGAARRPGQEATGDSRDPTRPSTQAELGSKSVFQWKNLWGDKEEYGTFGGEPPRSSLTQPPVGYRTPSPAQPYGVGKEKWIGQAANPMDTPAMRGVER
jgi:hypothetical protein